MYSCTYERIIITINIYFVHDKNIILNDQSWEDYEATYLLYLFSNVKTFNNLFVFQNVSLRYNFERGLL